MKTPHARVTGGKMDVVDGEIVMILEPTGEVVPLDRWRRLAREHQNCCAQCPYSSWIAADRRPQG
jgi:hypothetical protein